MEKSRLCWKFYILVELYLCLAPTFFIHCDARKSGHLLSGTSHSRNSEMSELIRKIKALKKVDVDMPLDSSSNTQPYGVSSPFTLPPYDSLPPIPLPENTPPFCVYPPFTPQPPPATIPSPMGGYTPLPPPSPVGTVPSPPESSPPEIVPSPPEYNPPTIFPSPPESNPPVVETPSPPSNVPTPTIPLQPSPPFSGLNPPINVPSPSGFIPSPRVFHPPIVYPRPAVPPPPYVAPVMASWCVAKPSVPGPIIQEAMNYACGSGAECDQIQPNGPCFQPNTLLAHASYAFNSYWQRTKVAGGTCEFGGTAMLVTVDPSYDGCHFIYF